MPPHPPANPGSEPALLLRKLQPRLESLHENSCAGEWGLTLSQFAASIERSVQKRFAEAEATEQALEEYLETLHVDDLVLAAACREGSESAWEYFVTTYRGYLRAAAGAILKGSRSGADAQELADSLFAELFGLADGKRGEKSLFRYFHGRSSLKTWLRAVLAQRHVDHLRQSRRLEPVEREDGEEKPLNLETGPVPLADPHRARYVQRFQEALTACFQALPVEDRKRLELYYAREKTLAEIGRIFREHESSASRHLERVRRELRERVEGLLRAGSSSLGGQAGDGHAGARAMSDAEIALCFQYAAEDAPIDFRQMFPEKAPQRTGAGRKDSL